MVGLDNQNFEVLWSMPRRSQPSRSTRTAAPNATGFIHVSSHRRKTLAALTAQPSARALGMIAFHLPAGFKIAPCSPPRGLDRHAPRLRHHPKMVLTPDLHDSATFKRAGARARIRQRVPPQPTIQRRETDLQQVRISRDPTPERVLSCAIVRAIVGALRLGLA